VLCRVNETDLRVLWPRRLVAIVYRVEVDREPANLLRGRRLPAEARMRLALAIKELGMEPRRGDKHLKGEYHCFGVEGLGTTASSTAC